MIEHWKKLHGEKFLAHNAGDKSKRLQQTALSQMLMKCTR